MDLFGESNASSSAKLDIRTRPEESLNHFTINKDFAERYLHNKQRAELHQLEAKYGKDALESGDEDSETDSESDVTEDEDGDQVNANVDAAIFRTLQRIRNKDAALYDSKTDIFAQEAEAAERAARLSGSSSAGPKKAGTTKKDKKVTLQDYQRQRVQELIETSDNPAEALADATTSDRAKGIYNDQEGEAMPFAQEQEALRKEVSHAFHAGIDDADDLFVKRSEAQNGDGSSSYRDAVIASLGPNADEETIRQAIRRDQPGQVSASTSVLVADDANDDKKNEDFLLNYILNRGWIDKSAEDARPVKPRLTKAALKSKDAAEYGDSAEGEKSANGGEQSYGRDWEAEAAELESEASFDSMADAFETAYNFRFEQGPESLTIPTYSRTPKESARREDNTRKRKREERTARKDEEKRLKMQELSRLKNLKRQEIVDKLKKLREVTGSSAVDLDGLDLEGDFDPDSHDKAMQKAFGDQYYDGEDDDEKPSWDDDINIDDIIKDHEAATASSGKKGKKAKQSHADDEDRIEMDADFMEDGGEAADGGAAGSKEAALRARLADKKLSKKDRKKLKKKLKAALSKTSNNADGGDDSDSDAEADADGVDVSAMDADNLPAVTASDPTDKKTVAKEMIDSYYNLDYEDMIGDLPTRFKYTQVAPADYGMSAVDILLADDEQLNNVVGLKNLQPYRRGKNRPMDLGKKLGQFRKDVYGNTSKTADGQDKPVKKRMGKKERNRLKAAEAGAEKKD
ncbi:potential nucleolar ribosome biogenesis factor [Pseudozyma hubeiensis SY62]|uniref:Potential nucleolar ribosome biogenesis factor n=1 Tax=Pseudozyma hubeiensis (strain SY62) TaxID=1305764 RepID=R9PIW5_PSEHS|nr:potential nucleolar ribosome biogenesis factor [Pseudozyma hubeiensis SY62]GAC98060.1 potential nucleolar ribosome biogenesis factor [Pseudozyma hubeiensis SY62]